MTIFPNFRNNKLNTSIVLASVLALTACGSNPSNNQNTSQPNQTKTNTAINQGLPLLC